MSEEKEYLTEEKFDEFTRELQYLKTEKRKEVAESLEYAKSLGDLSENTEYHEARDVQAMVEDKIARLEYILKNAQIVSKHGTGDVSVGSVVTVVKKDSDEEKEFTIVGSEEADMASLKISIKSPFGKAIMGKKKGETFSFTTPSGNMNYVIKQIK